MKRMNEYEYEIYNLIRNAFHSQSGFFLSKSESYEVMLKVKEVFKERDSTATSVSNVSELVCVECGGKKNIKFSAMKNFQAYCEDCRDE